MAKLGRPPKYFSDDKCHQLGQDLLSWLDDPKGGKEQIFFVRWYYHKHGMFRDDWKALIQREIFLPYYEIARKVMVENLMRNEDIYQSYGGRYLAMYDDELRADEEAVKDREAARNTKVPENSPDFMKNLALIDQFFQQLRLKQTSENIIALV